MSLDLQPIVPLSARRLSTRALRSWLAPLTACVVLAAACGGDEATGDPDFGAGALGPFGNGGGSSNPAVPGVGTPGSNANNSGNNSVGSNDNLPSASGTPGTNNNNEPNQGNGTPTTNNGNNAGNNNGGPSGAAGSGSGAPVGNAGAGGAPSTAPPPAGTAGSAQMPPAPPPAGAAGSAQMPPSQPPPPPPPAGPDIDCPAGASFCSGFEGTALPEGMAHAVGSNPAAGAFVLDATEAFEGNQSLSVPATGNGGFFYRAFAVPVPGQDFWVRLYLHLSSPLGDNSHDSVFGASSGGLAADVNGEALVELSEQFNEVLLNTDDALFNPPTNMTLPAGQWLCMEAHYVGGNGNVEIFMNETPIITATGYRPLTFQSFRFGYMRYNDDRTIRYDNVVVAPQRVGCP